VSGDDSQVWILSQAENSESEEEVIIKNTTGLNVIGIFKEEDNKQKYVSWGISDGSS
jgi:hypothetical protein